MPNSGMELKPAKCDGVGCADFHKGAWPDGLCDECKAYRWLFRKLRPASYWWDSPGPEHFVQVCGVWIYRG